MSVRQANPRRVTRVLRAAILLTVAPAASPALGQVVTDGTLGAAGAVPKVGSTYRIDASLGQRRGTNLFHSFSRLDVSPGETAQFSSQQSGVSNVLARVTGGQASNINGTLQCTIPDANFYLINPAGVVFGPTGQIDVGGSFAVTTADVVRLADGGRFDAATPANSVLTTAAPSAFGFLAPQPRSVVVRGAASDEGPATALAVRPGASLSIIGGGITVQDARLNAPGARVNLVSVASAGEVALDAADATSQVATTGFSAMGDLLLSGAVVDVTDADSDGNIIGPAGGIVLRGGNVTLSAGAELQSITGEGPGGDIVVGAAVLRLSEGAGIGTGTRGAGAGGRIRLTGATAIEFTTGGTAQSLVEGSGSGGGIEVAAPRVLIDGSAPDVPLEDVPLTGLMTETFGDGAGGDVTIEVTNDLQLLDSGFAVATTSGAGGGGRVVVRAAQALVTVDGRGFPDFTGFAANAENIEGLDATGPAGSIDIVARALQVLEGGGVSSNSILEGAGPAGGVRVQARDVLIHAFGSEAATGIDANSGRLVDPGDENGVGRDQVGGGPGGDIRITSGTLRIFQGGAVRSNTFGANDAGRIVISTGRLLANGAGTTETTGVGAQVEPGASGRGGSIQIVARDIVLRHGGRVSVGTFDRGAGGDLSVSAGSIRLEDGGLIESASGSRQTDGGRGGDVSLTAGRSLLLSGGSRITARSEVNDAGDVLVRVRDALVLTDSEITTAAGAADLRDAEGRSIGGGGGNIDIDPMFVVLNNSRVLANARVMSGGNIRIQADNFIRSQGSPIDASSEQSTPGTVSINAREIDVAGGLVAMPTVLQDPDARLREICRAFGESTSSFMVTGRGGTPPEPGGWAPAANFILPPPAPPPPVSLIGSGRRSP